MAFTYSGPWESWTASAKDAWRANLYVGQRVKDGITKGKKTHTIVDLNFPEPVIPGRPKKGGHWVGLRRDATGTVYGLPSYQVRPENWTAPVKFEAKPPTPRPVSQAEDFTMMLYIKRRSGNTLVSTEQLREMIISWIKPSNYVEDVFDIG